MTNHKSLINVAIISFDGVEELDLIGPWQTFQSANEISPTFNTKVLSLNGNGVTAAQGLYLGAHDSFLNYNAVDVLLIPGGIGTRTIMKDTIFINNLQKLASNSTWITSVCTGSLVLAQAGLLKGKKCTTYHAVCEYLEEMNMTGQVLRNDRYVEDGNVITSAGVSAGIDMSLYLIGKLVNIEFARKVQQAIQYYPQPPFQD